MLCKIIVSSGNEERRCLLIRKVDPDGYRVDGENIWWFVKEVCRYTNFIDIKRLMYAYQNEFDIACCCMDPNYSDIAFAEWNLIVAMEELEMYEERLLI